MTYDKMHTYDDETNWYSSADIPVFIGDTSQIFDHGCALSESRYILAVSNLSTEPYRLFLYDASSESPLASWSYADDVVCPVHMWTRCFFTMPDGKVLYVPASYTPYIYHIDPDGKGMSKAIEFRYDSDVMKESDVKIIRGHQKEIQEFWSSTTTAFPARHLVNSRYVLTMIKKGKVNTIHTIVSDRKTGKKMRIDHFDFDKEKYKMPLMKYIDEDYCYLVEQKYFILESPDILMDKADQAEKLLADIEDEDYVLLKYKFKKR